MSNVVVLSDYRKAKTEPKWVTYDEWLRFCLDPFGFLAAAARRNRTEGDER